jgi:hypothetical protein
VKCIATRTFKNRIDSLLCWPLTPFQSLEFDLRFHRRLLCIAVVFWWTKVLVITNKSSWISFTSDLQSNLLVKSLCKIEYASMVCSQRFYSRIVSDLIRRLSVLFTRRQILESVWSVVAVYCRNALTYFHFAMSARNWWLCESHGNTAMLWLRLWSQGGRPEWRLQSRLQSRQSTWQQPKTTSVRNEKSGFAIVKIRYVIVRRTRFPAVCTWPHSRRSALRPRNWLSDWSLLHPERSQRTWVVQCCIIIIRALRWRGSYWKYGVKSC